MRVLIFAATAAFLLSACGQPRGPRIKGPVPFAGNPSVILANDIAQSQAVKETQNAYSVLYDTAADNAVVFTPKPTNAKPWLKQQAALADVAWEPHEVFMSCDGKTGATTGAIKWKEAGGYYTTIWQYFPTKLNEGVWRWMLTHSGRLENPRQAPEFLKTKTASCKGEPTAPIAAPPVGVQTKKGFSRDQTLSWTWQYRPDGSRTLKVDYWDGAAWQRGITDSEKPDTQPAAG